MPIYRLDARLHAFPDPEEATECGGLLAIGGDFSVGRLVRAYAQGIFPWPIEEAPRAWWSPDPRFVLYPEAFRVPRSLGRVLKPIQSMFASVADASKCAFARLVCALKAQGCCLIDCQVKTEHLARFGAREVSRRQFLSDLASALEPAAGVLDWKQIAILCAAGTVCGTAAHLDGCV